MNTKKIRIALCAAVVFCMPAAALATDGTVGATSEGNTNLSITTTDYIIISNVSNNLVNVGAYVPGAGVDSEEEVCVYTNQASQQYEVTARCTMGASATDCGDPADPFLLTSDVTGDTIPYVVRYDDDLDCSDGDALSLETATTADYVGTDVYPCDPPGGATDNACFSVTITDANIMAVAPGTYSGVLYILVDPD